MDVYDRILSLGCLLGLVAVLGWAIRPQLTSGTTVQSRASREVPAAVSQMPALATHHVAATSSPALSPARIATATRTPTPINVGNFVWNDLDGDGLQDVGEPGLNGITVQLWNAAKTQLIDSAVTNANGNYTVVAPVPGNYRVRVVLPLGGATFTLKDQGSSDLLDSDINPSGADLGFTDIYIFGSNLISITTIDAGLLNVPATPTMTATPVVGARKIYLPLLVK